MAAEYMSLPFAEAIKFFMDKKLITTGSWAELWQEAHSRAFTVAHQANADMLADIQAAVSKGLTDGTTLAEFRKDFDQLLKTRGWADVEAKGPAYIRWRTGVIFNTNLSTAYAAGRYKQMSSAAVRAARPYWRYVASSSAEPRPEHMQWYNLVLPADDPFWATHYPPNGWGCKCGVQALAPEEVEELEAEFKGSAQEVRREAPPVRTYDWKNPATGELVKVPVGIDPGWAYAPGQAAPGGNA